MNSRSNKFAVLHQLSQEIEPISLHELLKRLGGTYVERTVRRWLVEMIQENLVEKLGNKRGTKYKATPSTSKQSAVIAIYELQNTSPMLDLYMFSYMRTCAMYDSTIKAIGFDEIRVRYRGERRALVRDIILKKLTGKELKKYVSTKIPKLIPQKDQKNFTEDLYEDLTEMSLSRIAGLGITPKQLKTWLTRQKTT